MRNDKLNDLEWSLSEIFGKDDIEETELNDLMWFDPDVIYEFVGLLTESEIEEEIEETESEIEYITEYLDTLEEELEECEPGSDEWQNIRGNFEAYKIDINNLYDELDRLREELEEF